MASIYSLKFVSQTVCENGVKHESIINSELGKSGFFQEEIINDFKIEPEKPVLLFSFAPPSGGFYDMGSFYGSRRSLGLNCVTTGLTYENTFLTGPIGYLPNLRDPMVEFSFTRGETVRSEIQRFGNLTCGSTTMPKLWMINSDQLLGMSPDFLTPEKLLDLMILLNTSTTLEDEERGLKELLQSKEAIEEVGFYHNKYIQPHLLQN